MYTLYQIDSRNICFLLIFHGKNGPYFPYFLLLSASLFVCNYRAATPLCICPSLWLKGFSFPSVLRRGPLLLWPFSLLLLLLWQLQKKSRDATARVAGTNHDKRQLIFWNQIDNFFDNATIYWSHLVIASNQLYVPCCTCSGNYFGKNT